MNGITAFEAMSNVSDSLIMEAAEKLGFLNGGAAVVKTERRKGPSAFSRFMNSGWGVAAVCALVAVSVMGGIIWAGNQPGVKPPVVTPEETTAPSEIESENEDYIGEDQTEVMIRHGKKAIYPRKFFMWSGSADGMRFYEYVQIEQVQPILPKVYYAVDGGISPCELILPEGCKIDHVSIYGTDMMEKTFVTYDGDFHYTYLLDIPVGRYYIALQMEWKSARNEYAFELEVVNTASEVTDAEETEAQPQTPAFDVTASLSAIDQLASDNFSIRLNYNTEHYGALPQEFSGDLGQANGKYWSRVDLDGTAIWEEEGGYYHKYTFESSKWRYYDTYEMTAKEAFDKVFNGRYWWKNYLDTLTFEAYDELVYMGDEQVLEQDCYLFSFEGAVTDGSQVKLALYVNPSDNQVMKMEAEIIRSSDASHLSTDVRKAVIEVERIRTGDELTGPTLPDPKWNGPVETPDDPEDPSQGGVVIPPSGANPSIDPGNGMLEQFPLISPDNTTGYVVLPNLRSGEASSVGFYIQPTDTENPSHTCVLKYEIPQHSAANMQIIAVEKSADEYCFLFMVEYLEEYEVDGEHTFHAVMTCAEIQFFGNALPSETPDTYYVMREHQFADVTYTLSTLQSVIDENRDRSLEALEKAETWLADYTEEAGYQYTVLYRCTMHDESIKTPVNRVPSFLFELYREYGLME